MSEYQRYEVMMCDWPPTREQLEAVNTLSSHIKSLVHARRGLNLTVSVPIVQHQRQPRNMLYLP